MQAHEPDTLRDDVAPPAAPSPSLSGLDVGCVRVLQAAAVLGEWFWRAGVLALTPSLSQRTVDDALVALTSVSIVRPGEGPSLGGEAGWRFVDATVRASVLSQASAADRARMHTRAAAWLQTVGVLDARVIGGHLLAGNDPQAAAPWCVEAARASVDEKDYDAALTWSEHAIALGVDATTEAALRVIEVGVYDARGALEDAERCARAAWEVAPKGTMEWFRGASSLAVISMRLLRAECLRELEPALAEALRNPAVGVAAAGLAQALFPMLQAGHYALADLLLERLEEILASGEHPEPTFAARVYAARAMCANYAGDTQRFVDESRRAAQTYELRDELRFALIHWNNVGFGLASLGDSDGAITLLRAVIEQARGADLERIAVATEHNLGLALLIEGRIDASVSLERRVVAAADDIGDAWLAAAARVYLARSLVAAGSYREARDVAERGLGAVRAHPGAKVLGLAVFADASLGCGDLDAAIRATDEGMRVLDALGSVEEGEALLRVVRFEALRAAGRDDDARRALAMAHGRINARAERLAPASAQIRFLYSVPEHARTLAHVDAAPRSPRGV